MNMQDMMSMMGSGDMSNAMNLISKFAGNKGNREQLMKQMNSAYDKMNEVFVENLIGILYKEYPTESLGSLFKTTDDAKEKADILTGLITKSAPSVLSKMNESDIDKLYSILQRKRG